MCNAYGHPPGCTCGWGGVNYSSGSVAPERPKKIQNHHENNLSRTLPPGLQTATSEKLAGGFVNPNATCKHCGESVYFYESPAGGRVFFDSLGPPWPKHQCLEQNEINPLKQEKSSPDSWVHEMWQPLISVDIHPRIGSKDIYEVNGSFDGFNKKMFFEAKYPVAAHVFRCRSIPGGLYEISILDFHKESKTWFYWSGLASIDPRITPAPLRIISLSETQDVEKHLNGGYRREKFNALLSSILNDQSVDLDDFLECPICSLKLKKKSITKHFNKNHKPR